MDLQTLHVYQQNAPTIAARHGAGADQHLHELISAFFHAGGKTADIGCGSGRDTVWLMEHAFPVVGYDPSTEMLKCARDIYPGLELSVDSLPELATIPDGHFQNVLCSAVLMHIPGEHLAEAVIALARILAPGGRIVLRYRGSTTGSDREPDGRLFVPISSEAMTDHLEAAGLNILHTGTREELTPAPHSWRYFAAEKTER